MSGVALPSCGYGFAEAKGVNGTFSLFSERWLSRYNQPSEYRSSSSSVTVQLGSAYKDLLTRTSQPSAGPRPCTPWFHGGEALRPGILRDEGIAHQKWQGWSPEIWKLESLYQPDFDRAYQALPDIATDAENQAVTSAMNRMGDNKMQLGSDLLQARQTIDMVADASSTLWRSYIAARRGHLKRALRILGTNGRGKRGVADTHLEIIFGWMPLLGTIHDGYSWFEEHGSKPYFLSTRGSNSRSSSASGDTGLGSYTATQTVTSRCGIICRLKSDFTRGLSKAGLTNPLQVAWEIVPFSFVVDWFAPVGNLLQTYSDSSGLDFVTGYSNRKVTTTIDYKIDSSYQSENSFERVEGRVHGKSSKSILFFKRNAYGDFPRPSLYFNQSPFNKERLVTALSLYAQATK